MVSTLYNYSSMNIFQKKKKLQKGEKTEIYFLIFIFIATNYCREKFNV